MDILVAALVGFIIGMIVDHKFKVISSFRKSSKKL